MVLISSESFVLGLICLSKFKTISVCHQHTHMSNDNTLFNKVFLCIGQVVASCAATRLSLQVTTQASHGGAPVFTESLLGGPLYSL